ncbi:MAG: hypothetical protein QOJ40_2262 [Verrucomicrobiota bacterium]
MNSTAILLRVMALLIVWLAANPAQSAVSLSTLVSFNSTNGAIPSGALIQAGDGSFYGTTFSGGANGAGTVFQMTPAGDLTTLISFNGTNGGGPLNALLQAADGNFYGATYYGGDNNFGTIFRLTTSGAFTTLVSFNDANGSYPKGDLVQASDGNLYGTTVAGGSSSSGTVFQLMTNGQLVTFFSFDDRGSRPYSSPMQVPDGSFYGTTFQGGAYGYGAIFRLITNGVFAPLYSFTGTNDGAYPEAGLVQGADGSLYGTTSYGGINGQGTAFKLTTNGVLTTMVLFANTNGAVPQATLMCGSDGYFYGTTSHGGAYTNDIGTGNGTVFRLTTNGALTTIFSFNGTNGAGPQARLVQGADGSFYGTTANGGATGNGTVFRLSVLQAPVFQLVSRTNNLLTLTWSTSTGQRYQLQYQTNLNPLTWSNLGGVITATNATATVSDPIGTDPQRFYRVMLLP